MCRYVDMYMFEPRALRRAGCVGKGSGGAAAADDIGRGGGRHNFLSSSLADLRLVA